MLNEFTYNFGQDVYKTYSINPHKQTLLLRLGWNIVLLQGSFLLIIEFHVNAR
jgi:hypothetical protein